jgi:choice-of-anchor A domain-containing protein
MEMLMSRFVIAACVVGGVAGSAMAGSIHDWNHVVRRDLHNTSEVEGSALVGGNLYGTSNYAAHLVTASNGAGLAVGGNIASGNIQINHGGDLRIAGSVNGVVNLNGGGQTVNTASAAADVASIFSQANAYSSYLAGLSATSSVDGGGNMNGSANTMINGQRVAVFSMTQSMLTSLGQLNLNFGSAQLVVINFDASASGGSVNLNAPPNLIGGFNSSNASRIVWNFLNTTSISVNNTFNGMMLAPSADLSLNGGAINGTVIVDNVRAMNAEIHNTGFSGNLVVVPLPAAAWSGLAMLGGVMVVRRVRRGR